VAARHPYDGAKLLRHGRAITGICVVLASACALGVPLARAGSYQVALCHDPASGLTAPTDGVSFPTAGAAVAAGVYQGCGATGYLYATLDGVAPHPPGDLAAWEFRAPANTTITAIEAYRAFSAAPVQPYRAPIDELDEVAAGGAMTALDDCSQAFGCSSSGTGPLSEFDPANLLDFASLTGVSAIEGTAACGGGLTCAAGSGASCPELGGDPCIAANRLYAMVVTLEDDTPPSVADVSGTLVTPGVLAGVAGIAFHATDSGSGLYTASLAVDGASVVQGPLAYGADRCVPIDGPGSSGLQTGVLRFDWAVPCPLSGGGTLELDTTTLHDGPHTVLVTATDAAGNSATAWSGTIQTDNAPQGGIPQISGAAQQGQTLSATPGGWSPAPSALAYQWERCDAAGGDCAAIPGATAAAYTATAADAYHQLAVSVTASDAEGSTSALSAASGVVLDANGYTGPPQSPALTAGSLPSISGTAREGATLTAQPGSWAPGPLTYAYQWQRCDAAGLGCTAIAGATDAGYRLLSADDYARLRVLVSATGPGGTSQAASEPSRVVADAGGATAPGVEGTPPASATPHAAVPAGSCADPRLHATLDGAASATVRFGRSVTLRGSLRCGSAPIADGAVDLVLAPTAGTSPVRLARVQTAADGSFVYVVGPGSSRRINVSYRESAAEAKPAARVSLRLLVIASVSLSIAPTHTSNGGTITFSGRVSGGDEPRGGLPLELEYLEAGRWMIYTVIPSDPADGRFSYRYTFRRTTRSITYTFRVAIPAAGVAGYPFEAAASPARSVHVIP